MAEDEPPLGVSSTVTALGETQLPPRSPLAGGTVRVSAAARYAHVARLGRGGMGEVDEVWDGDLMRELAVKRMRPELRDDPRMVAQFLWEARVGAYLDHPNIVPVHDLGTSPTTGPFFTMKRAVGAPLDQLLARLRAGDVETARTLPLPRRLRLLHQVCQAIAFAHRRGVLHRDLKPGNVLVGEDGEVLVMDWGLAIPAPGPAGEHLRRVMPDGVDELSAGTPLYMSPEQADGAPLDERSDVFTLGVMLYEIVALAHPFRGGSSAELAAQRAGVRPVREVCPDAPPSLAAVVARAMAPEPAARYASAAELADELELAIDGRTPLAEHASVFTRFARFYGTHDRAMAQLRVMDIDLWMAASLCTGVALGAVTGAALGGWWWTALVAAVVLGWNPTRRWLALRRPRPRRLEAPRRARTP